MLILDVNDRLVMHLNNTHVFLSNPSGGPVTLTHEQYALIGGLVEELMACRACEGYGRVPHEYGERLPMQDCASCEGEGWKLSVKGVAVLGKLMASYTRPDPEEERAARVRAKYQRDVAERQGTALIRQTDAGSTPVIPNTPAEASLMGDSGVEAGANTCGRVTSTVTSP